MGAAPQDGVINQIMQLFYFCYCGFFFLSGIAMFLEMNIFLRQEDY